MKNEDEMEGGGSNEVEMEDRMRMMNDEWRLRMSWREKDRMRNEEWGWDEGGGSNAEWGMMLRWWEEDRMKNEDEMEGGGSNEDELKGGGSNKEWGLRMRWREEDWMRNEDLG